eukprot:TRINITY_DN1338_c0_g1_i7.p1 TRINITY_DN1338_c0_g1~~TRINITY_DN1338_c0_g1_i7.p1  ORF type:complete len:298 (-),score=71.02 TRINITY_DN1338_c0_g1_i7:685-1578(-)
MFMKTLCSVNEMFNGSMHQDAHELLNVVLNNMIDTLHHQRGQGSVAETSVRDESEDKNETVNLEGDEAKDDLDETNNEVDEDANNDRDEVNLSSTLTFVEKIFQGHLSSETKCLRCENVTSRKESFLDLSIDIQNHTSISYCLSQFSKTEMMFKKDKYWCGNCLSRQEALRRMKIRDVPDILILHMKRFKYVESMESFRKLCYRVVFPFEIKFHNSVDSTVDIDQPYELLAVVVHIGTAMRYGHYVSFVKSHGVWLLYDDEKIEVVDEEMIRSCFGKIRSTHHQDGYILFYQKVNTL